MKRNILFFALSVIFSVMSYADGVLTLGEKKFFVGEGDGKWDIARAPRDSEGKLLGGECTFGVMGVDNEGHIYFRDSRNNRILVFTMDGKPWQIIAHPDLLFPNVLKFGENNELYITGVTRDEREDIQFKVELKDEKWIFTKMKKPVIPFGKEGLLFIESDELSSPIQLIDSSFKKVKEVPSAFFDQKGRYYKSLSEEKAIGIYDETGKLLIKIPSVDPLLFRYGDWIYNVQNLDGVDFLIRYGENGKIEEKIMLDYEPATLPFVSPNGKYLIKWSWGNAEKRGHWISQMILK